MQLHLAVGSAGLVQQCPGCHGQARAHRASQLILVDNAVTASQHVHLDLCCTAFLPRPESWSGGAQHGSAWLRHWAGECRSSTCCC